MTRTSAKITGSRWGWHVLFSIVCWVLLTAAGSYLHSAPEALDTRFETDLFLKNDVGKATESPEVETTIRAILKTLEAGAVPAAAVKVDYPLEGALFPPDICRPTFLWHDDAEDARTWLIDVAFGNIPHRIHVLTDGKRPEPRIDPRCMTKTNVFKETPHQASARGWIPSHRVWEIMKRHSSESDAVVTVRGLAGGQRVVSVGRVTIRTSKDPVGAPIFYRDVPLMPSETKDGIIKPLDDSAFPLIQWRLRDVSKFDPPVIMQHLPTCANCHSFSRDGKTLAMDMDGPGGDKGAHVLKDVSTRMTVESDDVFTWNSFTEDREKPRTGQSFGLFPQISPDGRHIVATVHESVYVQNYMDYRFLQTFYPTRGILAVYHRDTGEIRRLPGADEAKYVQSNATWSPDGKTLVFIRAEARDSYGEGARAEHANDPNETQVRYDLYRIPFNEGKGGAAEPIEGASGNGMSHSFPRFTPDGRWIVFVGCTNGLLIRPDSKLYIIPAEGGEAREMRCNTSRMNSWHSFSPNGRWMVFVSKANTPYTQMFLTHIDADGNASPAVLVPDSTMANRAVNLPEFVNIASDALVSITTPAVEYRRHLDLGKEHMEKGRTREALAELQKSAELKPDYPDTQLMLGNLLAAYGNPTQAVGYYRKAIEIDPRLFDAHNNLGVCLARLEKFEEAVEQFTRALEIYPKSAQTYDMLGTALSRQGKLDDAVRAFRKALELDPKYVEAHTNLGDALSRAGRPAEAVEHFRKAVEIRPESLPAHYGWGSALVRLGKADEAVGHFRKVIEMNPRYVYAHNRLARILATHPDDKLRDGAEAVRLAEIACRSTGDRDPYFLDTLAAAYAETGRFTQAVRTAQKARNIATASKDVRLAAQIRAHLTLFMRQQPLRSGN
ncbi:MAG TPA: tetratricopeptide repeat protein [Planctomycetota bacterium]|nr:tetratricopeptide repeat protein [Planctomycetota bacterium]